MSIGQNDLLSLADLKERFGFEAKGLRAAQRKGLRVTKIGRKKFVLGAELLRFLGGQTA